MARSLRLYLWLLLALAVSAAAAPPADSRAAKWAEYVTPSDCALLDDARTAGRMDGLLFVLAKACDREAQFLGRIEGEGSAVLPGEAPSAVDVAVSNPAGDTGASRTQSETSVEVNPITGTLCGAYNDSFHGVTQNLGFSGFSRSTDQGATWTDRGAVSADDSGDPSLVWRRVDGKFYYAALRNGGLALYRSDDDCLNFTFVSQIANGSDDKELMAIDNNPASPFYGRIYIVWTDFGQGGRIFSTYSTDAGATWSAQLAVSAAGLDVQGAWPAVAPNGDLFAGWIAWLGGGFPDGNLEVQIARSTNGGVSYALVTAPMTNKVNPRDSAASGTCGRPALKGNIRYLPSPQIAVDSTGALHAVYSYDPDGFNTGDVVDVFYRKSTDSGATWAAEVKINDDATLRDQYQPSMAIGTGGVVTIGYYSRQLDPNNLNLDYYSRTSFNGGATWQPSVRLSDVSSPVVLDPALASCYHGDYDQQVHRTGFAQLLWSDDRGGTPDIFTEAIPAGTDFLVVPTPGSRDICAPADAPYTLDVLQFLGFTEPVTLAASGNPAGTTAGFSTNPVTPPGSSTLTIGNTGAATPGVYTIAISGTSSPSGIVRSNQVQLGVYAGAPAAPTLTAPANGAVGQPKRPVFTWGAVAGTQIYRIEVDNNADFSSPAFQTTTAGTSAQPASDLATNTLFYWRVRGENACGEGNYSAVFTFTTEPAPGDCPAGKVPVVSFRESFEGGAAGWSSSGTGNTWAASSTRVHDGGFSWHANTPASVTDQRLVSPPIVLPPAGQAPITLQFWNHQDMEDRSGGCFDGGLLEASTDDGGTWTQVGAPNLLTDPYDGPISTCCSNPLQNLSAWCGNPQDWLNSIVGIDSLAGQTVRFRFRVGTDSSVTFEGWYLDTVVVRSCVAGLFRDDFESGDTSAWAASQ